MRKPRVIIPGQSLTDTPGNANWEKPPQIVDPKEALALHLNRLADEEVSEGILDAIELGMDIQTITKGIVRSAVAEGIHDINVGLMVSPLIHEKIKLDAELAGIEYDDGFENKAERAKRDKALRSAKLAKSLGLRSSARKGKSQTKEPQEEKEVTPMERPVQQNGLMSRGADQ